MNNPTENHPAEDHPGDQFLWAYHDGELPAEQRALLASHLAWCTPCLGRLEQLGRLSALMKSTVPDRISQIALRRLHARLDEVMERGLIRLAWEASAAAAVILLAGSIWLLHAGDASAATSPVSVPPWVASQASADPVVAEAPTPAAAWYLADSRNSSEVGP